MAASPSIETGKVSSFKCINKDHGCDANMLMSMFNNTCVNCRGTIEKVSVAQYLHSHFSNHCLLQDEVIVRLKEDSKYVHFNCAFATDVQAAEQCEDCLGLIQPGEECEVIKFLGKLTKAHKICPQREELLVSSASAAESPIMGLDGHIYRDCGPLIVLDEHTPTDSKAVDPGLWNGSTAGSVQRENDDSVWHEKDKAQTIFKRNFDQIDDITDFLGLSSTQTSCETKVSKAAKATGRKAGTKKFKTENT